MSQTRLLFLSLEGPSLLATLSGLSCSTDESVDPEGSPCSVEVGCPDSYACKMFDESCEPLAQGECRLIESGHAGCSFSPPNACTCSGHIVPVYCIELGYEYITDAAVCSTGTFTCGDKTCTNVVEACLEQTDAGGTTYTCINAAEHGCGHGVADCPCLGPEFPSGTCTVGPTGTSITIAVATVAN